MATLISSAIGIIFLLCVIWFGNALSKHNQEMARNHVVEKPVVFEAPAGDTNYLHYLETIRPVSKKYPSLTNAIPAMYSFREKQGLERRKECSFMLTSLRSLYNQISHEEIQVILGIPDDSNMTYRATYHRSRANMAMYFEFQSNTLSKVFMSGWPKPILRKDN